MHYHQSLLYQDITVNQMMVQSIRHRPTGKTEMSEILNDRYRLDKELGEGGMAIVYQATDLMLERTIAVKILRKDFSASTAFHRRLIHFSRTDSSAGAVAIMGTNASMALLTAVRESAPVTGKPWASSQVIITVVHEGDGILTCVHLIIPLAQAGHDVIV